MHLMYYLDEKGERIYTLKVPRCQMHATRRTRI
jgi:hypothetical protein